jgi:hypothetical protein
MVELPFIIGVERSRLHGKLFVGDLLLIVAVMSVGMLQHNEIPWQVPERTALVIGPFLVSWLVVAYVMGAYTGDARRSVIDATENASGTWFVTALVGAGLRSTPYLPGESPLTFVAVIVAAGAVALSVWRGGITQIVGPSES